MIDYGGVNTEGGSIWKREYYLDAEELQVFFSGTEEQIMWNAIDSSSCSNCLANLAEKDGNYRTYKICFTLDPGNGAKIVEEASVYEALSTVFNFNFLYGGSSTEFESENPSSEITIPLCLACAFILKELFRRFQEFSYQRRPNSLIAAKLNQIEANFIRIHGNLSDPFVITSDVHPSKGLKDGETQTESPYLTETFTQVDSPDHSPSLQEFSPAMSNDIEKEDKGTYTDLEIPNTLDNTTQTVIQTEESSTLTDTPCITVTEVQTDFPHSRTVETNTEHGSTADSDSQTEIHLSDRSMETDPEPKILTTELHSQTDIIQLEEKSTFTETDVINNETQTEIVVSTDVGILTEQPKPVAKDSQTDSVCYSEIGTATELPEPSTVDTQTDIVCHSEIGTATELPEPSTVDTQTDSICCSEIGTATEQTEPASVDTQTDKVCCSEIGTATELPKPASADTQTELLALCSRGTSPLTVKMKNSYSQTTAKLALKQMVTTDTVERVEAGNQIEYIRDGLIKVEENTPASSGSMSLGKGSATRRSKRLRGEVCVSPDTSTQVDYPTCTIKTEPESDVDESLGLSRSGDTSIVDMVPRKRPRKLKTTEQPAKVEDHQTESLTDCPEISTTRSGRHLRKIKTLDISVPTCTVASSRKIVPRSETAANTRNSSRIQIPPDTKPNFLLNPTVQLVDIIKNSQLKVSSPTQLRKPGSRISHNTVITPVQIKTPGRICKTRIDFSNVSPINTPSTSFHASCVSPSVDTISKSKLLQSVECFPVPARVVALKTFLVVEMLPTDDDIRKLKPYQISAPYSCPVCRVSVYSLINYRTHVAKHLFESSKTVITNIVLKFSGNIQRVNSLAVLLCCMPMYKLQSNKQHGDSSTNYAPIWYVQIFHLT
ncbi:unnamed protein product [Allacma fusca]|uniref:C2H2-type domain-containing protein n=1 Tax=Allacma fusca TaxID=39272 RepID=A0A8J2LDG1_9HEXA|nr:unnamed protein product [Allacma fusca]